MFQFAFESPLLPLPYEKPAFARPLFRLPKRSHHDRTPRGCICHPCPVRRPGLLLFLVEGDVRPLFQPLLRGGLKFTPVSGD